MEKDMLRRIFALFMAAAMLMAVSAVQAAGHTALTWYGHAAFKIVTPAGHVVLIDPWITNPSNPKGKDDLAHFRIKHKAVTRAALSSQEMMFGSYLRTIIRSTRKELRGKRRESANSSLN